MKITARHHVAIFAALAGAILFTAASAAEFSRGGIVVSGAWARASFGTAGAAYVSIENTGQTADQLVGAATPAARRAMVHDHVEEGGILKMRHIMALDLPPRQTRRFKPGGLHIMLMGLGVPLKQGSVFHLTLTFQRAGQITVPVRVLGVAAMHPGGAPMRH